MVVVVVGGGGGGGGGGLESIRPANCVMLPTPIVYDFEEFMNAQNAHIDGKTTTSMGSLWLYIMLYI